MTTLTLPEPDLAERAETLRNECVAAGRLSAAHFIVRGRKAIDLHAMEGWRYLGFDSFKELCYAPLEAGGLDMDPRRVYHSMRVAEAFVNRLEVPLTQLASIDHTKLELLQPVVTEDNVERILADAEMLTTGDLRKRRREGVYGGQEAPLDAESEPEVLIVNTAWKGTRYALEYEGDIVMELTAEGDEYRGLTERIARLLNEEGK
jgi:hypothetical protein